MQSSERRSCWALSLYTATICSLCMNVLLDSILQNVGNPDLIDFVQWDAQSTCVHHMLGCYFCDGYATSTSMIEPVGGKWEASPSNPRKSTSDHATLSPAWVLQDCQMRLRHQSSLRSRVLLRRPVAWILQNGLCLRGSHLSNTTYYLSNTDVLQNWRRM